MEVDNNCPDGFWDPRTLWPEFEPLGHFNHAADMQAIYDLTLSARTHDPPKESDHFDDYHFRFMPTGPAVIEIGTWMGQTARMLAEHGAKLFCVDTWEGNDDHTGVIANELGSGDVYRRFCENVKSHLNQRIFSMPGFSSSVAMSIWPHPAQVDMVFIDAGHAYEDVLEDIQIWEPMIRPGGIICGHDYNNYIHGTETGVKRAVDELGLDGVLGKSVWWRRVK